MGGSNSMSAIAGRVLLIPRGNYDATATYTMLDMVVYNGSSYICKQTSTGNLPTDTTYWMLNASGSAVAYLNDIGDVVITNVSDGQVLMYDSATQKWVNGTISTTLSGLSDTQIATLSNGQVLKYDSASSKWVNADNSLSNLSDANISSATNGQSLIYNSTSQKWENGNEKLSNLSDANISSATNKDILQYNSTNSKWENKALYKKLTATLTAGQTTLTFTDSSIVATSLVKLFSAEELDYESATSAVGSVTFTFEAQASDVTFTLLVMNL